MRLKFHDFKLIDQYKLNQNKFIRVTIFVKCHNQFLTIMHEMHNNMNV